jgi:hypothetical protein
MAEKPSSSISKVLIFIIIILIIGFGAYYYYTNRALMQVKTEVGESLVEISYPEKLYQLSDGSYLRLGFSILVNEETEDEAKDILLDKSQSKVANGLHMILGDKTIQDLIDGSHKRDGFAEEIKKMLEREIFQEYNASQQTPSERIQVRDVLIQEFVTQQN